MLHDVVEVKPLNNYELFIRFEDDLSGRVDIKKLITFTGIFSPLADEAYFKTVKVNPDLGTIYWDNGADIASDTLYATMLNTKIKKD